MKTEEQRKIDFLIGLANLTRQTGIAVYGCGCCGSPDLIALEHAAMDERAGYGYGDNGEVVWISPADSYDWEKLSESIVRPAA